MVSVKEGGDPQKGLNRGEFGSGIIMVAVIYFLIMKFLPKLFFVKDDSFDYAEKIENLIKQTNK